MSAINSTYLITLICFNVTMLSSDNRVYLKIIFYSNVTINFFIKLLAD